MTFTIELPYFLVDRLAVIPQSEWSNFAADAIAEKFSKEAVAAAQELKVTVYDTMNRAFSEAASSSPPDAVMLPPLPLPGSALNARIARESAGDTRSTGERLRDGWEEIQ